MLHLLLLTFIGHSWTRTFTVYLMDPYADFTLDANDMNFLCRQKWVARFTNVTVHT